VADKREERVALGMRRIRSVLKARVVATMRTLEQKISDAGPNPQRIDPHLLTIARKNLVQDGTIRPLSAGNALWFHLAVSPNSDVQARLAKLLPIYEAVSSRNFVMRMGQTLEIAIHRTLIAEPPLEFFGNFPDLSEHGDDRLYRKEEPPASIAGRHIPGDGRLDFIFRHPEAGYVGIEAKNLREWLYPNRPEIKDLLRKAFYLNAVPVLVARRIHYSTFSVLRHCGLVMHETYNQLFPSADASLAAEASNKSLLGYHDVRVGNEPDDRLRRFLRTHLPTLLPAARQAFNEYNDLVKAYAVDQMPYREFAARVKRRSRGEPEDLHPFEDEDLE
jgi:hypothetical protein